MMLFLVNKLFHNDLKLSVPLQFHTNTQQFTIQAKHDQLPSKN
jgi:hypothetical protein